MLNWIAKYWQHLYNIYIKKKEQHKKPILESAANIKFTCQLYLVPIDIFLNWKIIYHSELPMNE